jgi:FkbM family methyltransferase
VFKKIKNIVNRFVRPPLHCPTTSLSYVVLGSEYGAWPLPPSMVGPDTTIFSFGIGEDISFDLGAIREFGCKVFGFDPTPKCLGWIEAQDLLTGFTFFPVGVGGLDGDAEFHPPAVDGNASYSRAPKAHSASTETIKAPILRLETIISRYSLPVPDVLKMDIEGFEYEVLVDLLSSQLRPSLVLVEFHHGIYSGIGPDKTNLAVDHLCAAGYALFYVSRGGHEYGFVWTGQDG